MSMVTEWLLEKEYNDDLTNFLQSLYENDQLSGAILGITKQILDQGIESLTGKQLPAIESFVDRYSGEVECERCSNGNILSLLDYIQLHNGSLCSTCEHEKEKYMNS